MGSSLDAYDAFARGDWGWGLVHTALAISDVFLVKAIAVGIGKLAVKGLAAAAVKKTTTKTSIKLLSPAPAKLTQEGLEHIIKRHWFTSNAKRAGKFLNDLTGKQLKSMITKATTKGAFRPNTMNRAGTIAEYHFGRIIGVTTKGKPAYRLRVIINPNGTVKTAFPF